MSDRRPMRGVLWRPERQSWRVKLKQRKGPKPLEFYLEHKNRHVAGLIYDAVARMVHGRQKAVVNFPEEELPPEILACDLFARLVKAGWAIDALHPLVAPTRTAELASTC